MHSLLVLLIITLLPLSFVGADVVTDTLHLQSLASNFANSVYASLNGTAYLNTSSIITDMTYAIQQTDSASMSNTSSPGSANVTLNQAYLNYIDEVGNLADTVQRRGRLFHSELNLPVYQALQSLSSAVHGFGYDLTHKDMINQNSTIRTMTSGSSIIRAQAAWANNQNYPGRRKT